MCDISAAFNAGCRCVQYLLLDVILVGTGRNCSPTSAKRNVLCRWLLCFLPSFLPSSLEISQVSHRANCRGPTVNTTILISRIPSSDVRDARGPILPRAARKAYHVHTYVPPRGEAELSRSKREGGGKSLARSWSAPIGYYDSESTTRYVYNADCRNSRKLMRIRAVVTQEARNGSGGVFPGIGARCLFYT